MNDVYRQLAERNGWSYSFDDNRPYFMKNGNYAIPDDSTSIEDKKLLADIISEGSIEMAQLILLCWDNGIVISGPCSGIRKFHDKPPYSLHFSFCAGRDIIDPLYTSLRALFPTFDHLYRDVKDMIRYDIDYPLNGRELTVEESNEIYSIIRNQLQSVLENKETLKH